MASDAILRTFGDSAIREDVVLNAIEILTARETQIFNMLGKTEAIQTILSFKRIEVITSIRIIGMCY